MNRLAIALLCICLAPGAVLAADKTMGSAMKSDAMAKDSMAKDSKMKATPKDSMAHDAMSAQSAKPKKQHKDKMKPDMAREPAKDKAM